MTSNFKFIDHTADIAVEVSGNTYEELFIAALDGWKNSAIEFSQHKRDAEERDINLTERTIEVLLVSFLQEMNYLLESKKIIPIEVKEIQIKKIVEGLQLYVNILFGNILPDDVTKFEIKAVTYHQLDIKKENDVYRTIIVFDI